MDNNISKQVISRLPRYLRYLGSLKDKNIERISSRELSGIMNVTASQIRQDLNQFGGFGQQGYGYNVEKLYDEISKIIGVDHIHNCIIIGAGNLGKAVAGYTEFERRGFIVQALFDNNENKIGNAVRGIKIYGMDSISDFIAQNDIDIAILTVPSAAAKDIAEKVASEGISAIWNFTNTDLDIDAECVVENVHLLDSLMTLSYNIEKNG